MEETYSREFRKEEFKEISNSEEVEKIVEWVNNIKDETLREQALAELSRKRESFADLANYIWYTSGVVSCLLQEIINTYTLLAPPTLNIQSSNRACNVLALFQCVAAHPDTRPSFLAAQIPIFFYPFLNTVNKNKPFEYLRLTALGVIGALVKVDNPNVIGFLLSTEIIPLCLRVMERGSELSKTVATFIVQRILLDENGLNYVCNTAERFYAISSVLFSMISSNPSSRLVKHIIRSYARLAENNRVRAILRDNLPPIFKDKNFYQSLEESSKRWLQNLLKLIQINSISSSDRVTMQLINGLNPNQVLINQNEMPNNPYSFPNYSEYIEGNNLNVNNIGTNLKNLSYGSGSSNISNSNKSFNNFNQNVFTYKNGK